jgi:hypothetical protein
MPYLVSPLNMLLQSSLARQGSRRHLSPYITVSSALFPTPTPVFSRPNFLSPICTLLVDDHCERLRIQTKQILSQHQTRQPPLLDQWLAGSAKAARPGGPASSYSAALRRGYGETITDQCNYSSETYSHEEMIGSIRQANNHVDKVLRKPHTRPITCFYIQTPTNDNAVISPLSFLFNSDLQTSPYDSPILRSPKSVALWAECFKVSAEGNDRWTLTTTDRSTPRLPCAHDLTIPRLVLLPPRAIHPWVFAISTSRKETRASADRRNGKPNQTGKGNLQEKDKGECGQ